MTLAGVRDVVFFRLFNQSVPFNQRIMRLGLLLTLFQREFLCIQTNGTHAEKKGCENE